MSQSRQAVKILDGWNEASPKRERRELHIVCWTPADREFPAKHEERLDRILKQIQGFYASEMQRNGFGNRSFNLTLDENESVVFHNLRGKEEARHYGKQSGREIRTECLPALAKAGINADRETIVIFCNLASWDEERRRFSHRSPYYAGGNYRSGTAWQLDSPELDITNLHRKQPIIRDGQYGRISLGKHNSIFIGGIAHELGHALGLPHCRPRRDEMPAGTPLMGSGNRTYGDELRGEGLGSFLTFAHAMRLASHPQFSGSVKGLDADAKSTVSDLVVEAKGASIQVSGSVEGTPPVYGVVAYFDPEGGGDYDSTTVTSVPDQQGRFSMSMADFSAGKPGELRLVPLHCNGAIGRPSALAKLKFQYRISKDGRPDPESISPRE